MNTIPPKNLPKYCGPPKNHLDYVVELERLVKWQQYDRLTNYVNFSICELANNKDLLRSIIMYSGKNIIKHILDHTPNFYTGTELTLYDYFYKYMPDKTLRNYFIDKYKLNKKFIR